MKHRHLIEHDHDGVERFAHQNREGVVLPDSVILVNLAGVEPQPSWVDDEFPIVTFIEMGFQHQGETINGFVLIPELARKHAYRILAACEAIEKGTQP